MGFGHLFIRDDAEKVLGALDRYLVGRGYGAVPMSSERHPRKMREVHETDLRLFWIAPPLNGWTGIFEFRFYDNELRERWGYTDEALAPWLSQELKTRVLRMEVLDSQGFWLYSMLENGKESEGKAYQDNPAERTADRSHPRYDLNHLIEREGIRNVGLGYENIPGPCVGLVENCHFWTEGIDGLEGFVHRAYQAKDLAASAAKRMREGKQAGDDH